MLLGNNKIQYLPFLKNNNFLKVKAKEYKAKSGFHKKKHFVILYIFIGLVVTLTFYTFWFYNLEQKKEFTFDLNEVVRIDSTGIVFKNDNTLTNIKTKLETKEEEKIFTSFSTFYNDFFSDKGDFVGWFMGFYGLIAIIIGFYEWSKFEKFSLLFQNSKDKIKMLDKFSANSNSIFYQSSIYENIINLLERLEDEIKNSKHQNLHLKMLLCSPLLDKDSSNFNKWGNEFIDKIKHLSTAKKVKIELFHLPNNTVYGVNPLRNFTEVLAKYIKDDDAEKAFEQIWKSTEKNLGILANLSTEPNTLLTINKYKDPETNDVGDVFLDDIPFQIIISKTPLLQEVIVSFAGKSNLENENVKGSPKGFHSVDPVVVETFDKIFDEYVSDKKRVPIRPEHTQKIINEITSLNCESNINNYLDSNSDDIFKKYYVTINVKIAPKTFSPLIANSSKFTSRVIQETIRKEDVFLEIGAGSGVQTILAYKMLQKLGNQDPKVFAIENSQTAFNCLKDNCLTNSVYSENNGNRTSGVYIFKEDFANEHSQDFKDKFTNNKFTYIVADLPFVDTKVNDADKDLESAFFDEKHKLQESLLKFFAENNEMIDEKARLLTSFSSLGGDLDILSFEMLINKHNLSTIKKVAFVENGYEWITYVIMRRSSFVNFLPSKPDRYWWEELNVKS